MDPARIYFLLNFKLNEGSEENFCLTLTEL